MAQITLRVLDGADRGRVFDTLDTPVTIGREEGNTIQLNDERVSRFHVKIQEDHDRLVLTDLESTNGTKVNGEDIQLRILRNGDMIHVGRSVLVVGSRDDIAQRLAQLRNSKTKSSWFRRNKEDAEDLPPIDPDAPWKDNEDLQEALFCLEPPELPERLSPGQAAQLAELIEYMHIRLRQLLSSVKEEKKGDRVTLDARQWQSLLDLQSRLAEYLRSVGDPDAPGAE